MRSAVVTDPNRKLQPGDILTFRIEQDKEAATLIAVRPGGEVVVEPLDRAVHVAGLTVDGAAAELKRALEKDYYYAATVRLVLDKMTEGSLGRVYLSGAVNRAGEFKIPSDRTMKLSDVLVSSGGPAKFAKMSDVRLTRVVNGEPQVFHVDIGKVIAKSRVDLDMDVRDGDRIVVPETFFQGR